MFDGLSSFFRWWLGELAAIRSSLNPFRRTTGRKYLVAKHGAGSVTFYSGNPSQNNELASVSDAATRDKVRAEIIRRHRNRNLAYLLSPGDCLRHNLDLPMAAKENLRQTISYQIDEFTPFVAEDVFFNFRYRDNQRENSEQLRLEVLVAPKTVVSQQLQRISTWGLKADYVGVVAPGEIGAINLLPREPSVSHSSYLWVSRLLYLTIVALLAATFTLSLSRQQRTLDGLQQQIASARKSAVKVADLRRQIARADELGRFVAAQKQQAPITVELLVEITRLLPDDTYLTSLRYTGGKLDLVGFSEKAAGLIGRLQTSRMLREVRFTAPVTVHTKSAKERFRLSAKVIGAAK